jgi:hypothetical protein
LGHFALFDVQGEDVLVGEVVAVAGRVLGPLRSVERSRSVLAWGLSLMFIRVSERVLLEELVVIVVIEDMAGIWICISSIRVVQVHGSRTSIRTWVSTDEVRELSNVSPAGSRT